MNKRKFVSRIALVIVVLGWGGSAWAESARSLVEAILAVLARAEAGGYLERATGAERS